MKGEHTQSHTNAWICKHEYLRTTTATRTRVSLFLLFGKGYQWKAIVWMLQNLRGDGCCVLHCLNRPLVFVAH